MSPTSPCPDEAVLLALAADDAAAPEVRSHVAACASCRRKLRRLKAEILHLRSSIKLAPKPAPPAVPNGN